MAINEIVIQHVPFGREDTPAILRQVKESGATAVQLYTFWKDFEPHGEGGFDWEHFDAQVKQIQEAGLQWVPFLLMGPKYAAPDWWLNDPRHKGLVCLEHGKESPIESIWNPAFREQVTRVVKAFAAHYGPWDVIQSVQPGICGDYGEAIMPVQGNWPGDYHTHMGYWCGDEYAAAHFRRAMKEKFGTVEAMNAAWRSHYASFEELTPFLPHQTPSRTALFDELRWYKDAMTEFADFWLGTCRAAFPDTPVYLCTGGVEEPQHASDFAAQAKVCAKHGAGIRLTNENSHFFDNYFFTALTHAACEQYGTYLGLEPAGYITAEGVCARMFGSAVYGNRQMMYYYSNIFRERTAVGEAIYDERSERFMQYLPLLSERRSTCDAAFFWPGLVGALGGGIPDGIHPFVIMLRRMTSVKPMNEQMIADGALSSCRLLIMPPAAFTDRATLHAVCEYVKGGGHVLALGRTADIELEPVTEYDELFGILPTSEVGFGGAYYHVRGDERFPRLANARGYTHNQGVFGLHPDTVELVGCDFWGNNYSGTTTAAMSNVFMREYPSGGAAVMYMGPHLFDYNPQKPLAEHPLLTSLVLDMLERYTDSAELCTLPGEQARGYIGDVLYALRDDGEITRVE
ncbi:MAG: glycosyl hydrolase family protein [Ruminococcaceae bacterium]|nr:glycosyl hydrolase family protein [Oscillospiraceae bacterium]